MRLVGPAAALAAAAVLAACSSSPARFDARPPLAPVTSQPAPSPAGTAAAPAPGLSAVPTPDRRTLATLAGKVVAIDPGHNGGNAAAPDVINRLVDLVTERKACDTTGTETAGGYTESAYNLDVARRLAALLQARGARVVLTRSTDSGVGPCITERAATGNAAHADAALSIHADGGPPGGLGFHVIEPADVGPNAGIVAPSARLGRLVHDTFHAETAEPFATYLGAEGYTTRSDLGGLNLSAVPKVFIECGNMRNAADAARLGDPAWRQGAAQALADGITAFLSPP